MHITNLHNRTQRHNSIQFTFILFLIIPLKIICQTDTIAITYDTTTSLLPTLIVTAFNQNRSTENSAINIDFLDTKTTRQFNKSSLVPSINSISGVRMEERSPGSYRLNIRGSSLRSPFGVRNVKIYWNEIPVTDPGGNTYFNQFSVNNISTFEIIKGPVGSSYGSGTGGVILLNSFEKKWSPGINIEYINGSFGLNNLLVNANLNDPKNKIKISYNHLEYKGYREHTNVKRDNISIVSKYNSANSNETSISLLFNKLYYQTPGGLTLSEFKKDPRKSRPASGVLPSAIEAGAAIYQRNILAGINQKIKLSDNLKNTSSIYLAYADIENPTIRNYENRKEPHFGIRSEFALNSGLINDHFLLFSTGIESQFGFFNTQVSKNLNATPDTLLSDDNISYSNISIFVQADYSFKNRLFILGGLSINKINVQFKRLNEYPVKEINRSYQNEFAPRLSVKYKVHQSFSLGTTISKGFSPPTIAELLPSTGVISTNLQAEKGFNYELNLTGNILNKLLLLKLNAFNFNLENALVQRKDSSGADYFINAGNTIQRGLEIEAHSAIDLSPNSIVNHINAGIAYSYSDFRYNNIRKDTLNLSGKLLPGIPQNVLAILISLDLKYKFQLFFNYYYSSALFLNDSNNAKAEAYQLIGTKLSWTLTLKSLNINLFTGADNLLNGIYSLGNDINDPRGRFYNAAPARNFYLGISLDFKVKK